MKMDENAKIDEAYNKLYIAALDVEHAGNGHSDLKKAAIEYAVVCGHVLPCEECGNQGYKRHCDRTLCDQEDVCNKCGGKGFVQ